MNDQQPTSAGSAADWAELAGQPATPASLLALAGADPTTMTGTALVDAIIASEKALSLLAGTQMRFLTALAVPFIAGDPTRLAAQLARKSCITGDDDPEQVTHFLPQAAACLAAAEVAAALRIPSRTASLRVQEADTMTGVLAPTLHALEHGTLDRAKARVIAEHCQPLTPDHTHDLQDLVLPGAGDLTTSELRDAAGQAVIIIDPDGAEHRHQQAAARRDLAMTAQPDGMATLKAHLPSDGAVKIFQVTDLLAAGTAGTPGDTRGIGARRVDALIDIADHLLTHGFVDLTDYLGQELPDHNTPRERARARRETTTSGSTETASPNPADTKPTDPSGATGDRTPKAENTSTTGDVASPQIPTDTDTASPEVGTPDHDQPATTSTSDTSDIRATADPVATDSDPPAS